MRGRAILLILAATIVAYSNTLHGPFVFDDIGAIPGNVAVRMDRPTFDQAWEAMWYGHCDTRPVTYLTFAINHLVDGYMVEGYHAVNLVLHLVNVLLVWHLARTLPLGVRRTDAVAILAATIFALQPIQTQAVTYVVQRAVLLAVAFSLIAIVLYVRGRAAPWWRWWPWAILCGVLAIGSKEIAVVLPILVFVIEWGAYQRFSIDWFGQRFHWCFLAASLLVLVGFAYLKFDPVGMLEIAYSNRPWSMWERLLTQPRVVMQYVGLILLPLPGWQCMCHYVQHSTGLVTPWTTLGSLLGVVGIVAGTVAAAWRGWIMPAFCLAWFLVTLVLESTILPLEMMHEHRLYFPMVGVSILASWCIVSATARWRFVPIVAGTLLAGVLAVGTYCRNEVWRDPVTAWTDVIVKNAGTVEAARALEQRGHLHTFGRRWEEAFGDYRDALNMCPQSGSILVSLGNLFQSQGNHAVALVFFKRAIDVAPDAVTARNDLAWLLATSRHESVRDGERALREAIRVCEATDWRDGRMIDTLAAAYAACGMWSEAVTWQEMAIRKAHRTERWHMRDRLRKYKFKIPARTE